MSSNWVKFKEKKKRGIQSLGGTLDKDTELNYLKTWFYYLESCASPTKANKGL